MGSTRPAGRPQDESGISAAEATLGQRLKVPGQVTASQVGDLPTVHMPPAVIPATQRTYAEVLASTPSPLDSAEWVYVRRGGVGKPLADNYDGPFRVLQRGDKVFKLQLGEREDTVSRDRLKPHVAKTEPVPAAPRQRGRPRARDLVTCVV